MEKQAEATAVPYADSAATQASMAPVPTASVGNKPAPGQTGPKGLSPRTNYSRVNSGSAPNADLGASVQKALAPDSQSFLPHKVAHTEVPMSISHTMTIHELVKAAAASVNERIVVAQEAERQSVTPAQTTKVASPTDESIPTAYIDKLAEAMEYVVKEAMPGEGPNSLTVTDSHVGGKNPFTPGSQGQATPAHVVPKTPGLHAPAEVSKGPANALDDNASMKHPAQPVKLSSVSADELRAAVLAKVASKTEKPKEERKEEVKESGVACDKTASPAEGVNPKLVEYFLTTVKQAEDAINPAKISAGAAVPPETSASGQPGGAPAGGAPKGNTSLIASNDSAINFTKRDARAGTSAAMGKLLTEPALSAAHDKTLNMAFVNTPKAGVKIAAADPIRTAAARVVLEKMAAEAKEEDDKKKKKESGGGSFTAPPVGGVAGGAGGM